MTQTNIIYGTINYKKQFFWHIRSSYELQRSLRRKYRQKLGCGSVTSSVFKWARFEKKSRSEMLWYSHTKRTSLKLLIHEHHENVSMQQIPLVSHSNKLHNTRTSTERYLSCRGLKFYLADKMIKTITKTTILPVYLRGFTEKLRGAANKLRFCSGCVSTSWNYQRFIYCRTSRRNFSTWLEIPAAINGPAWKYRYFPN